MKIKCPDCKTIVTLDETGFTPGERVEGFCPRCGAMVSAVMEGSVEKKEIPRKEVNPASESTARPSVPSDKIKIKELELKEKELALKAQELEFARKQHAHHMETAQQKQQEPTPPIHNEPETAHFEYAYPTPEPLPERIGSSTKSSSWSFWLVGIVVVVCLIWFLIPSSNHNTEAESNSVEAATEETVATDVWEPGQPLPLSGNINDFSWLSENKLNSSDLYYYTKDELRLLRNAIFAMHGYRFQSADLQQYFSRFYGYTPVTSNVTDFDATENYNVGFIKRHE